MWVGKFVWLGATSRKAVGCKRDTLRSCGRTHEEPMCDISFQGMVVAVQEGPE